MTDHRSADPQPADPTDALPMAIDPVQAIWDQTVAIINPILDQIQWADEEVAAAMRRHPAQADVLYHASTLLGAPHPLMDQELVYRAHCRELLQRLVDGADTRPGTAAEVCCLCHDISQQAPLNSAAVGLYMRMWTAAGLPGEAFDAATAAHYEALYGARIDEWEADVRSKLASPRRRLTGDIHCDGLHDQHPVTCRYAVRTDKQGQDR